jgi:hypothetical protein
MQGGKIRKQPGYTHRSIMQMRGGESIQDIGSLTIP